MKVKRRSVVSNPLRPHGLYSPWNSPGQDTGVGSPALLQGIFPTQGSNPGLPHCRKILYQLNHKGSPRILEWVAYPCPVDLPDPGIELGSPALLGVLYQLSYQGSLIFCSSAKSLIFLLLLVLFYVEVEQKLLAFVMGNLIPLYNALLLLLLSRFSRVRLCVTP